MSEKPSIKTYQKNYYQQYRNRFKQINIRLNPSEYTQMKKLANLNGHSVPKQIKILAHSGYTSQRVLSPEFSMRLNSISAYIKSIANDLNHVASKYLFIEQSDIDIRQELGTVFEQLEALERMILQYFKHHDN